MGARSRRKGVRGELELATFLRERGIDAHRGRQFCGSPDSPDVVCDLPLHFEAKRCEALRLHEAMQQAIADAGAKIPCVAHRRNGGEWLAVLRLDDLLELIR